MYRVVSEGKVIAFCEELRYVRKKQSSGSYIQCKKEVAEAIAVNGKLYSLFSKPAIEDAPIADIMPVDSGEVLYRTNSTSQELADEVVPDLEEAVAELGGYVDESTTDNSDAIIELADYIASLEERIATLESGKE